MPKVADEPRTRTVKTETVEEVLVQDSSQGLGMGVFDWLRNCNDDELQLTEVSIYRNGPTRDGLLVKLGGNLGSYANPTLIERIDDAWVKEKFGGGDYGIKVHVKDGTRFGRNGFDGRVTVDLKDCPPKPNPFRAVIATPAVAASTVSSGENSRIDAALERLTSLVERLALDRQQPQASGHSETSAQVIDVMATAAKKGMEVVASQAQAAPRSEGSSLADAITLIVKLKDLFAPPAHQESELDKAMKQAMIAQLNNPKKSLLEEAKGLGELMTALQSLGGGGAAKADVWAILADKGIDRLPELINGVSDVLEKRVQFAREVARAEEIRRGGRPGPAAVESRPAPPPVRADSQAPASAPATGEIRLRRIDEPRPAAEAAPVQIPLDGDAGALIENFLKVRIVAMLHQGVDGQDLIIAVNAMRPDLVEILMKLNKEQIVEYFRRDAILSQAVDAAEFDETIEEAVDFMRESAKLQSKEGAN